MATAEEIQFLRMLTKSGDHSLAAAARDALDQMVVKFDPEQPRDGRGRWSLVGAAVHAVEHATRDAGKDDGKLSDEGFAARQAKVESMVAASKHLATDVAHSKDGRWDPERDKLHRQIADDLYAKADHVPNEGKAVIAGGLGGAGKSTVLRDHAGIDTSQYLTINPDDIKEELAKRGHVPDVPGHEDLSPMERSALIHEESSRIAKLVADKAHRDKKNLIWDITMSSEASVKSRLADLNRHGYKSTTGVFVDIPTEVSVERALARYRRGVDQYHAGEGHGGRYVPPSLIRAQSTSTGRTVNREVFDKLAPRFDHKMVYDNSVTGRAPVRIA